MVKELRNLDDKLLSRTEGRHHSPWFLCTLTSSCVVDVVCGELYQYWHFAYSI